MIPDLAGGNLESGDGMPGDEEAGTKTVRSGDAGGLYDPCLD